MRKLVKCCELCNKYQPAEPQLSNWQPDFPFMSLEKFGTHILVWSAQNDLIMDYYSRWHMIRLLRDITASIIDNPFTHILTEYALFFINVADCGSQFVSEKFKKMCKWSGITQIFSCPCHHEANNSIEKILLRKALKSMQSPYTAI